MLESSPTEFTDAYAAYAAEGWLLPRPEGSFLLEFVCGDRALYLFDRCGPYFFSGPARVLIHGLCEPEATGRTEPPADGQPWAETLGRSTLRGVGQVIVQTRRATVVDIGFPLLLSRPAYPPYPAGSWTVDAEVGGWLHFETLPPLHGYLVRQE